MAGLGNINDYNHAADVSKVSMIYQGFLYEPEQFGASEATELCLASRSVPVQAFFDGS